MNLREQIDQLKYVFLTDIGEPEANTLRVVIHEGRVTDETETIEVGAAKITDVHPIVWDETSRAYEITFPNYVAYAVVNESFANVDKIRRVHGPILSDILEVALSGLRGRGYVRVRRLSRQINAL